MLSVKNITVKQLGQDLHLSWQADSPVQLLRDGEILSDGVAQEFIDTTLAPLSPVQYELRTNHVRITIDTAVVADEGTLFWNQKSTVIIRSDQELLLVWGAIPDVESYSIFRNGKRLGDTDDHRWYEASSQDESARYEIRSLRPSSRQNVPLSSLMGGALKLLNQLKHEPDREREFESFILYILLHPFVSEPLASNKEPEAVRARLRIMTFIAPPILKNPNLLSPHIYFEGDDRTFDPHATEYRTLTEIAMTGLQDVPHVHLAKQANPTRSLTSTGRLRSEDVASTREVYLEDIEKDQDFLQFTTRHSVGNPLVIAPDINYMVHTAYGHGKWRLCGTHLRSPHHEIYLQTESCAFQPIHQTHDLGLSFLADPLPSCHWLFMEAR